MSISSLNNSAQTGLVPNSLLGYSTDGVSALEITPTAITIAGNLTTTPIYVGISASTGLTTTNPTGLDINCDFNMNQNNITNVASIIQEGNDLNINNGSSPLDINISAGSVLNLTGEDNVNITSTNTSVAISSYDGLTISSITSGINFSTNGTDVSFTNCPINMNLNNIVNTTGLITSGGNIDITAQTDDINLLATTGMSLSVNNGALNLTSSGAGITLSTDQQIDMTATTGTITLNSNVGDIQLNAPSASITANASADITLTSTAEDISLTAFADIFLNSSGNTTISAGLINLNTGNLFNSGGVVWNTYPMGITFFNKWNGTFNYNTPTAWEIINPTNPISFPPPFLHSTWAVQVSLNCWNVGSAPADKELAFYIDFLDGNSNTYTGFNYKQSTPFANYFNTSNYTNTAQQPLSITYTDYFDFTGAVNNLELRLNWYGNQSYPQDFNLSTTFTLMTLIS